MLGRRSLIFRDFLFLATYTAQSVHLPFTTKNLLFEKSIHLVRLDIQLNNNYLNQGLLKFSRKIQNIKAASIQDTRPPVVMNYNLTSSYNRWRVESRVIPTECRFFWTSTSANKETSKEIQIGFLFRCFKNDPNRLHHYQKDIHSWWAIQPKRLRRKLPSIILLSLRDTHTWIDKILKAKVDIQSNY